MSTTVALRPTLVVRAVIHSTTFLLLSVPTGAMKQLVSFMHGEMDLRGQWVNSGGHGGASFSSLPKGTASCHPVG